MPGPAIDATAPYVNGPNTFLQMHTVESPNQARTHVGYWQEQGATSRGYGLLSFQGCAVPAKTPPEIVARLSDLFVAAGKSDRVRELIKSQGIDEVSRVTFAFATASAT